MCPEIISWGLACFSFCIICPLKTLILNFVEKICEINIVFVYLVSIISSCAISIIFVVGIFIQLNGSVIENEFCQTYINFQSGFAVCEAIYIFFFVVSFCYLNYLKNKETNSDDGIISVKTLDD